jgi:N-methylhydantoinase A
MGAEPGPACYKRGGEKATVTDANVVLGYLGVDNLIGGRMKLGSDQAEKVIAKDVAKPLGIDVLEAAFSVWNTVNVNMTNAIKKITSWVGIDPREYVFVSGGGAGGIHIIPMMMELGIKKLIIPKAAGTFSAVGGLNSDIVAEFQKSYDCNTIDFDFQNVNTVLEELKQQANNFLISNEVNIQDRVLEFSVDACYYQQPWGLTIPLRKQSFDNQKDVETLVADYHTFHEQKRGSKEAGQWIACSTWRVKATGKTLKITLQKNRSNGSNKEITANYTRNAYFKELGGVVETPVYKGETLYAGFKMSAPAIIEQENTTIVVYPGSEVIVSEFGNYLMRLKN